MKRHACLLLTLAALAAGPCAAGSDYMPPDLRARVDQLKADMASIPTNTTNSTRDKSRKDFRYSTDDLFLNTFYNLFLISIDDNTGSNNTGCDHKRGQCHKIE